MSTFQGMTVPSHKIGIMIHCLATSKGWGRGKSADQMMEEVTRWHVQERGWSGVAYAAICDYDGNAALGRDLNADGNVLDERAAAARGFNTSYIHIAIAGGRGSLATDKFEQHYTPAQKAWLCEAIQEITDLAGRPMRVRGHNEVAAKACPGFNVRAWFGADACHPTKDLPPPAKLATGIWAALLRLLTGGKA